MEREGVGWQGEQTALLPLPAMGSVCVCEAERLQAVFMCSAEVLRATGNYCVLYRATHSRAKSLYHVRNSTQLNLNVHDDFSIEQNNAFN